VTVFRSCRRSMSRRKVWTVSRYVTLVAWRLVKKCRFSRMQQFAACLHFAWRTTSLRVSGRAARRSCLPGLHRGGGRQAGAMVLSCLVWRCELALRKLTGYQSAQRRSNYDCNQLYITNNFFSVFWNECLAVLVIVFIPSAKSYRPQELNRCRKSPAI